MYDDFARTIGLTKIGRHEYMNPRNNKTIKIDEGFVSITDDHENLTVGQILYLMQYAAGYTGATVLHANCDGMTPGQFIEVNEIDYTFLPSPVDDYRPTTIRLVMHDPLMNFSVTDGRLGVQTKMLSTDLIENASFMESLQRKLKTLVIKQMKATNVDGISMNPVGVYYDGRTIQFIFLGSLMEGTLQGTKMIPAYDIKLSDPTEELIMKGLRGIIAS